MALCQCGCCEPTPLATITDKRYGAVRGEPRRFIQGHGGHEVHTKHAMHGTPEYMAYHSAKARCTRPELRCWLNYGGRGIKFLFESFEQFYAELGPRPAGKTLDRRDNDGHYEPGNVRWATRSEQEKNKRRKKIPKDGFRVEHVSAMTGLYIAYTGRRSPVDRGMAEAYAAHLERNQCGGRIIENATGSVIKLWQGKYPAKEGQDGQMHAVRA
jgi:hypothetical protein